MGTAHRITEQFAAPFSGSKACRTSGTISGVLICGSNSANGRDYPPTTFRRDFALYEGRPVNADHGDKATVDRRIGWFSGVVVAEDGRPRGTLNLLKSHPMYERVMEAAERNPALFGFSHVIQAETSQKDGREVVEAIKRVESIDLVADPATTTSLFESKGKTVGKISLKEFGTRFGPKWGAKKWGAFEKLCEDMGDLSASPVMDAPADDAAPGDMKSALLAALAPMLDDAFDTGDSTKVVSALKDFIKLHAKHTGKDPAADGGGTDDDKSTPESKQVKPALPDSWAVLEECQKAGVTPRPSQLKMLARIADAKERAEFIAEIQDAFKSTGAETPVSVSREKIAVESTDTTAAEPTVDEIKKRMRG